MASTRGLPDRLDGLAGLDAGRVVSADSTSCSSWMALSFVRGVGGRRPDRAGLVCQRDHAVGSARWEGSHERETPKCQEFTAATTMTPPSVPSTAPSASGAPAAGEKIDCSAGREHADRTGA